MFWNGGTRKHRKNLSWVYAGSFIGLIYGIFLWLMFPANGKRDIIFVSMIIRSILRLRFLIALWTAKFNDGKNNRENNRRKRNRVWNSNHFINFKVCVSNYNKFQTSIMSFFLSFQNPKSNIHSWLNSFSSPTLYTQQSNSILPFSALWEN